MNNVLTRTETIVVGVDVETTGLAVESGHRLIQLGLALRQGDNLWTTSIFVNPKYRVWDPQAEMVHNISQEALAEIGVTEAEADTTMAGWLAEKVEPAHHGRLIATGFNVNSFDMRFIAHSLPAVAALFSYRPAELNSVCQVFDGKNGKTASEWKQDAKHYAETQIGVVMAHDAGWDALMHLHCFEFLKGVVA